MDGKDNFQTENLWKRRAFEQDKRFQEAAAWELSRGNRLPLSRRAVFVRAAEFKRMVDRGELTLTELETWVFGGRRWSNPAYRPKPMEFLDCNPPGGG